MGDDPSGDRDGTEAVVDFSVLAELEELGRETDFDFSEFIDLFHEQSVALIAAARASHAAGDVESFTRAAHTLKGSSRELGAEELGELADRWEQMGRRQELTATGDFFDKIEAAQRRASACLESYRQRRDTQPE